MNSIYENNLRLNFNKNVSEPGEIVTLNIKSDPNSVVAICVIDISTEMLEKSNQLTDDLILGQILDQQLTPYYKTMSQINRGFIYPVDSNRVFEHKGLIVLSDLNSLKQLGQCIYLRI